MIKTRYKRRSFLKVSAAAGGGMVLGFSWLAGCKADATPLKAIPSEWFDINAFLKIGDTGIVTIFSPNPEIGQNVKTSMPMIVAEELDVAWEDVIVEQAPLNTELYDRQVAGGSQSIRHGWKSLRMAGATARKMLVQAAADRWQISSEDCKVENGIIIHPDGSKLSYGDVASEAALLDIPENVALKDPSGFSIIGNSKRNVDMDGILSGKPLFGIDTKKEGMVYATAIRPPAFGQELESFDAEQAKNSHGIIDVFQFGNKIAILANDTWSAMAAQKLVNAQWKQSADPEDSTMHDRLLNQHLEQLSDEPLRNDGDVIKAFESADLVFEKTYSAPFLPHNCMEPMNFFADVSDDEAYLLGPIQTPERTRRQLSELLAQPEDNIHIDMTRMGGGFGRRLYGDFALEAAEISQIAGKPVQLVFTREDDMTAGIYRPASKYKIKAAVKDGQLTAYHLTEACINGGMWGAIANYFPADAVPNYRVDSHRVESNITTGAWRAPYTNFLAFAEQSFIDELAYQLDKDPVDFRLELLEKARNNSNHDEGNYEIDKYIGVINLAREKSGWDKKSSNQHLGFSVYYSHNTYVAEVAEVVTENDLPKIKKVTCAVDCGIVINPMAALNQVEGGIIDGIGHAMYGELSFQNGRAQSENFNNYRLIRIDEIPEIEVHFVESKNDPTGLGEPALPPAGGAIANALASYSGKRLYKQPFAGYKEIIG